MYGGKRRLDCRFAPADAKDKTAINQIMLRYRPIVPRPVSTGDHSSCRSMMFKQAGGAVTSKRNKRKYVRSVKKEKVVKDQCDLKINYDTKSWLDFDFDTSSSSGNDFVVTDLVSKVPDWISFDHKNDFVTSNVITPAPVLHDVDLAMAVHPGKVVESWILMESVTGVCEVGRWLGYDDDEIRKNLEKDSCPGFISNNHDEVQWVNLAYRRIGDPHPDGGGPPPDVVVSLGIKVEKKSLVKYWPAFSCSVRVAYQLSEKKMQMTVPCDVWKMDSGGFAWRLDVEAALSLGRFNN